MEEKRRLIEGARLNGSDFPARHNFLNRTARAAMEATRAFRIIRQMPKGGFENDDDGGDDDDGDDDKDDGGGGGGADDGGGSDDGDDHDEGHWGLPHHTSDA